MQTLSEKVKLYRFFIQRILYNFQLINLSRAHFFTFSAPYSEYNVTVIAATTVGDGVAVSMLGRTNQSSNLLLL